MNPIIIIPTRLASMRLPNKPLADIAGKPMIMHVVEQSQKANIGPVIVACDGVEIKEVVESHGAKAIITDANLPSGTDRIFAALSQLEDGEQYDAIINVQGDLPLVKPELICLMVKALESSGAEIATPVAEIHSQEEVHSDAVVKVAVSINEQKMGRALYFSRATIPWGDGVLYHHIGLYAYKRDALEKFVSLKPSPLEQREKLEQLRALENGMTITAVLANEAPLGVDRVEDLEHVKRIIEG
ncbi:MAG: 3-deoxy-manno-octulosonate cytidylyltransferase [Alphaproteobacteria bacterium]